MSCMDDLIGVKPDADLIITIENPRERLLNAQYDADDARNVPPIQFLVCAVIGWPLNEGEVDDQIAIKADRTHMEPALGRVITHLELKARRWHIDSVEIALDLLHYNQRWIPHKVSLGSLFEITLFIRLYDLKLYSRARDHVEWWFHLIRDEEYSSVNDAILMLGFLKEFEPDNKDLMRKMAALYLRKSFGQGRHIHIDVDGGLLVRLEEVRVQAIDTLLRGLQNLAAHINADDEYGSDSNMSPCTFNVMRRMIRCNQLGHELNLFFVSCPSQLYHDTNIERLFAGLKELKCVGHQVGNDVVSCSIEREVQGIIDAAEQVLGVSGLDWS